MPMAMAHGLPDDCLTLGSDNYDVRSVRERRLRIPSEEAHAHGQATAPEQGTP